MLKVKDNVDLKELENNYKRIIVFPNEYEDFYFYINEDRTIELPVDYTCLTYELEILYDLIKADLIEKVEDK